MKGLLLIPVEIVKESAGDGWWGVLAVIVCAIFLPMFACDKCSQFVTGEKIFFKDAIVRQGSIKTGAERPTDIIQNQPIKTPLEKSTTPKTKEIENKSTVPPKAIIQNENRRVLFRSVPPKAIIQNENSEPYKFDLDEEYERSKRILSEGRGSRDLKPNNAKTEILEEDTHSTQNESLEILYYSDSQMYIDAKKQCLRILIYERTNDDQEIFFKTIKLGRSIKLKTSLIKKYVFYVEYVESVKGLQKFDLVRLVDTVQEDGSHLLVPLIE